MSDLKKAKQHYDNIDIPPALTHRVSDALENASSKKKRRPYFKHYVAMPLLSASLLFFFMVNGSTAFASSLNDIPILHAIAKLFTVESYIKSDSSSYVDVTIPALTSTGNTELERRINKEIKARIEKSVAESEAFAKEFHEKSLSYDPDVDNDLHPFEITVDYNVKFTSEHFVSFVISKTETYVNAFVENTYYNIDLNTGQEITLKDLLGPNYKEIVNPIIHDEIARREANDKNQQFFEDEMGFNGIRDDQPFYINEDENIVIAFEKYEIAPGYMGILEFELN